MLLFCSCITQCVLCSWCIPVLVVAQDQLACPSAGLFCNSSGTTGPPSAPSPSRAWAWASSTSDRVTQHDLTLSTHTHHSDTHSMLLQTHWSTSTHRHTHTQHTSWATHTHSLTHSTHTHTHIHTHSYTHTHTHSQSQSHTHTHTHSQSHSHRHTHSHTPVHSHWQMFFIVLSLKNAVKFILERSEHIKLVITSHYGEIRLLSHRYSCISSYSPFKSLVHYPSSFMNVQLQWCVNPVDRKTQLISRFHSPPLKP